MQAPQRVTVAIPMPVDPIQGDSTLAPRHAGARAWVILVGLLILTALVYKPALTGGWLFDDSYYVDNPAIQVHHGRIAEWTLAALSQTGANQFRALSMLSFALNYYLAGPDPWWFKATNVALHLFNGVLLFAMLKALFGLVASRNAAPIPGAETPTRTPGPMFAAVITGLWLLAPINLTAVAYVSQRIESLATTFIFLGLLVYLRARIRQYQSNQSMTWGWLGMVTCLAIGVTAKESAVVLPAFTACVELAITGFRNRDGRWSRQAIAGHVVFLVLPMFLGLFWIAHWDFDSIKYLRSFTLTQRLLTEPRVLVHYLVWTVFPSSQSLSFYHDDITLSLGLMTPPTTAAAMVFLGCLPVVGFLARKPLPLFFLGSLWFFAGHAMTATIIPLELVFEHRNYLPSVGVFLAIGSLTTLLQGRRARLISTTMATIAMLYSANVTLLRSIEWSNPIRLAYAEANKQPESVRAQYGLAQILIVAANRDAASPWLAEARQHLERIVYRPDSGVAPAQALIYLDGIQHRPVDPALWNAILAKLRTPPVTITDASAITFLYRCMQHGDCQKQVPQMHAVLEAAVPSSGHNPDILAVYADFAFLELHDTALAERLDRDAIQRNPRAPTYRINLVTLLLVSGQPDKAAIELQALATMNHGGELDPDLHRLQDDLARVRSAVGHGSDTTPQHPEPARTR